MAAPICVNCISGDVLPGEPRGSSEKIGPFATYVSTPASVNEEHKQKAIVVFTDVFGLSLNNNKVIADTIADRTGMTVYTPDLFYGSPIEPSRIVLPTSSEEAANKSFFARITDTLKIIPLVPWVARNWPTGKFADVEAYLKALREQKGAQRVGAVGFCYGGKFAIDFNTKGLLDVSVGNHPSFVNAASFASLRAPILLNLSEHDDMFPVKAADEARAKLDADPNAPAHDFKVHEGTAHGFCARPDLSKDKVKKGFEDNVRFNGLFVIYSIPYTRIGKACQRCATLTFDDDVVVRVYTKAYRTVADPARRSKSAKESSVTLCY